VPALLNAGASAKVLCNRGWSALRYAIITRFRFQRGDTRDAIMEDALGDEEDAAVPHRQEVVWALVNAEAALRSLDVRALQRVLRVLGVDTSSATANDRSEDPQSSRSALVARVLAAAPPPAAARKHIAAFRIHRFLRGAFFNPSYAFARRFVIRKAGVGGSAANIDHVNIEY
jgi:hypothetical protein